MTRENPHGRRVRTIRSAFLEVLVIAFGILLALSADATWTMLKERSDTRTTLASVRAELEQNISALTALEQEHRDVEEAGKSILRLTGPNAEVLDEAQLVRLITTFWVPAEAELSRGALQAMLSSGGLARVESLELREGLASWSNRLDAGAQFDAMVVDSWVRRGSIRLHLFVPEINLSGQYSGWEIPSRFEPDYMGLLRDLQFESLIAQRMGLSAIGAGEAVRLQDQGRRILSLPGW